MELNQLQDNMNLGNTMNSSVASQDRNHIFQTSQKYLHSNSMSQTLKVQLIETLENQNVEIKERLQENVQVIRDLENQMEELKAKFDFS